MNEDDVFMPILALVFSIIVAILIIYSIFFTCTQ